MADRGVGTERVAALVDRLLPARLGALQRATGMPVVFGGATRLDAGGAHVGISGLLGTVGESLRGLQVRHGRGLGGAVLARGVPCRVNDYASAAITRDYDGPVGHERLVSILAFPVLVQGRVGGVVYGATRDRLPLGDSAVAATGRLTAQLQRDVSAALAAPAPADPARPAPGSARSRQALAELAAIIAGTSDAALRDRLTAIHRDLGGTPVPAPSGAALAPRELDVLRLVAVGASNAAIAGELGLSPTTVKSYLGTAMRKLEVRNRTAAVHAARTARLI